MTDRRQRQKEARAAKRAAQKKADQRRELFRRLGTAMVFGLAVVGVIVLITLANSREDVATAYESFRDQPTACGGEQPDLIVPMEFEAPQQQTDITADARVMATVSTSCGDLVIELDPQGYPETVNSFVFLARQGFYDGQVIHRVNPEFVIQGGDPSADGTGGPGYVIADERPPADFMFEPGVIAMANNGSRTTGSQFFVVVHDNGRLLTRNFNVLGRLVDGEDTIARITAIEVVNAPGSAERSRPVETVYIEAVTIDVDGS